MFLLRRHESYYHEELILVGSKAMISIFMHVKILTAKVKIPGATITVI